MTKDAEDMRYGEFKGSTEATLKSILLELKEIRTDLKNVTDNHNKRITALESFRVYVLGLAGAIGFLAAYFKEVIVKKL